MLGNWIKMSTTTVGTGNLTVSSVSGYPTIADQFATSQRFAYTLADSALAPLERGIGYMNSTPELVREAVLATYASSTYDGSNPSAVSLASGTKYVLVSEGAQTYMGAMPGIWANGIKCYGPPLIVGSGSTLAVTADRCYAFPCIAQGDSDIDAVLFRVTTGGAAGKLGAGAIYSVGRDGLPGVILATGSSVAVDSTGNKTSTFTRFRPPPRFFAAFLSDGAPTLVSHNTGTILSEILGADSSQGACRFIYHAGATSMTFPTTFTAVTNATNTNAPQVLVRIP